MEVPRKIRCTNLARTQARNCRRRASQISRDIDCVAGPSAGTQDRLPFWDRSNNDDVCLNSMQRLCCIAACQRDVKLIGQTQQAGQELIDPSLRSVGWKRQGEESRDRIASHGGDIAQAPGQAATTDHFGWKPVAAEVHAFQAEIRGDKQLVSRGAAENGAVVADTSHQRAAATGTPPNVFDQSCFTQGQAF